ncbi:hypothetical protein N9O95_00670 [Alphaproteobacteria bacterium]|jgi:hypothetical protein|nr:hypothetical protein [Alphaproteobacteria bacterium]
MNLVRRSWTQDLTLALSVFAVVALMTGVTLVALRWGNMTANAMTEEPVIAISDENMDTVFAEFERPDWNKLLYRITVVDFCGELTWHVREGYRIDRNQLQERQPISIGDAADLRHDAITLVEGQMNRNGIQDYSFWCSGQGQSAANYFRSVWNQYAAAN